MIIKYLMDLPGQSGLAEAQRMAGNHTPENARRIFLAAGMKLGDMVLIVGPANVTELIVAWYITRCMVLGLELNPERAAAAQQAANEWWQKDHADEGECPIKVLTGDVHSIPLEDACVTFACMVRVAEYLRDPLQALKEMQRVLKPGGTSAVYDIDGNCAWFGGMSPELSIVVQKIIRAVEAQNVFHPFIGRELVPLFHQAGYTAVAQPLFEIYHYVLGGADEAFLQNGLQKLAGLRRVGESKLGLGSREAYDTFVQEMIAFWGNPKTFTYSIGILATGVKPGP